MMGLGMGMSPGILLDLEAIKSPETEVEVGST
jgi:hypothetical protein